MANRPVAVLLCRFSDLPNTEPHQPDFYRNYFTEAGFGTGGAFDYWRDITYGGFNLSGSQVFGWFNIAHTSTDAATLAYPAGRSTVAQWCVDAAPPNGVNLAPFSAVIGVLNANNDHGSAGGNRMILGYGSAAWEPTFVLHEMGHCFGLDHSWHGYPDQVYGDRWDIMSAMNVLTFTGAYGAPTGPGLNAPYLERIGCLPAARVWTPSAPSITSVNLAALNQPEAQGHLAVKIPARFNNPTRTNSYFVEFRQRRGWDRGLPGDVVLVHEVRPNGLSYLLDPQIVVGTTSVFNSADGEVTVTLTGNDVIASRATVQIQVRPYVEPASCVPIKADLTRLRDELTQLHHALAAEADPYVRRSIVSLVVLKRREIDAKVRQGTQLGCRLP
jgi:Gametolysin peptidase M11